jgi:mannose-6-phosphate isomerase-like protein (cupin superfamily)
MNEIPREAIASDIWSPTLIGSYSCFKVKIFEPKGEFGWHVHDNYDELFVAIHGEFTLKLRNQDIPMKKGDSYLVAKGVEHTTVSVKQAMAVVIRSSEKISS